MADSEDKCTPSQPTKQPSYKEIVAGVRKIIAVKFKTKDLLELKSYVNGLIQVAGEEKKHVKKT